MCEEITIHGQLFGCDIVDIILNAKMTFKH